VGRAAGRAGDWAEVQLVLLAPAERAPGLPDDTAEVPLTARVRGFLEEAAEPGQAAAVRTALGRRVEGTLLDVLPPERHSFGRPIPELLAVGVELRGLQGKAGDV
jgi:2-amino-4-ketopentanoate thiolase alpha subunit